MCRPGVTVYNLLPANYPVDESIDSRTMESLGFCIQSPIGILKQIFHEMIEELPPGWRNTWGSKMMDRTFDIVHPSRWCYMILYANHCFICSSSTTWLVSCDEMSETVDINKTRRSDKVHNSRSWDSSKDGNLHHRQFMGTWSSNAAGGNGGLLTRDIVQLMSTSRIAFGP